MTNSVTHKQIRVSTDGTAGPYIIVPLSQLEPVKELLTQNQIKYWVDSDAISLDGKPHISVINLGHRVDATYVQTILDNYDCGK